ncbi:MAG TPA: hypothetical protein VHG91_05905 [Longimicrobium sp.]|nr:hypothetical protein [Longimicrobium sp.]
MKKLRLEIDQLEVESFDVPVTPAARGTVHGRWTSPGEPCGRSQWGECVPSYEAPCWWTGDPMQDCYAPSDLNVCTDHPAYC